MKQDTHQFSNLEELSRAAAGYISKLIQKTVKEYGCFTLALAGGQTPRLLYEQLVQPSLKLPWRQIHLFWGDERWVPADHPDSNFAMALQTLISHIPIPTENIHRIPVDLATPEETAKAYEQRLHDFFQHLKGLKCKALSEDEVFPVFDLVLLGIGKDGHTASLFPGNASLEEKQRWVVDVYTPNGIPPGYRITLTLPVINHAKCVMFLVSGPDKRDVVRTILDDPKRAIKLYPAAHVSPIKGQVLWFLDQ